MCRMHAAIERLLTGLLGSFLLRPILSLNISKNGKFPKYNHSSPSLSVPPMLMISCFKLLDFSWPTNDAASISRLSNLGRYSIRLPVPADIPHAWEFSRWVSVAWAISGIRQTADYIEEPSDSNSNSNATNTSHWVSLNNLHKFIAWLKSKSMPWLHHWIQLAMSFKKSVMSKKLPCAMSPSHGAFCGNTQSLVWLLQALLFILVGGIGGFENRHWVWKVPPCKRFFSLSMIYSLKNMVYKPP